MIIRRHHDDFQVEEMTSLTPDSGPHALYCLHKEGWTTADALAVVRRRWRIDHRRLSYGGLKDRHARTMQYFSILKGPARNLTQLGIKVRYLGQVETPFSAVHLQGNRFRLVLRRMSPEESAFALEHLPQVRNFGVPNYFDDQRFGSVAGGGPFMAKSLLKGDFEAAVHAALVEPYPHDRRQQKQEKKTLAKHWGDWATAKPLLPKGHARSLVDYLVHHPQDFRGAVARLRPDLRGLYLSAYQSHLWNRTLAAWMRARLPAERLLEKHLMLGPAPFHQHLTADKRSLLESLRVPLISARLTLEDPDPLTPFVRQILAEEEVTLEEFRLKGLREMFFSRGDRAALCLPKNLEWSVAADEVHPGMDKLTLGFELPRGSYATLLVKRVSP